MYKYTFSITNAYIGGHINIVVKDNNFKGAKILVESILKELPDPWNVVQNDSYSVINIEEE